MRPVILAPIVALGAYVVWKLVSWFLEESYHRRRAKQLGCLPPPKVGNEGPFGIYNAMQFLEADNNKRFPDMMAERFETASKAEGRTVITTRFKVGGEHFHTIDPALIQCILATQFDDFCLGYAREGNFKPLLGNGIFASDGQRWEHARAMLRPQFVRSQVGDLELDEKHFQNILRAITFKADGWTDPTDLMPLFFRFTLDAATEFLFGESVLSQLASLPEYRKARPTNGLDAEKFAKDFDFAQLTLAKAARLGDHFKFLHSKEMIRACKTCHDFVDYFVRLALDKRRNGTLDEEKGEKKYVFLEAVAKQTDDPLELRYQMLNILLAGRDTTASLLSWLFQLLAQHPETMKKLRATIIEHFGTYENPRDLSFATLKNCYYLQHNINEALRLYPAVSHNSRRCARTTTLPRGGGPDGLSPLYVREGQEVTYTVHVMHRRKDIWGPDADSFRPERWEGRKATHPFDFLPFNAGPRICLGQQLALIEASYVTVRLLQRIEQIDGFSEGCNVPAVGTPVRHGLTLTNCPADGVKIRMKLATEI